MGRYRLVLFVGLSLVLPFPSWLACADARSNGSRVGPTTAVVVSKRWLGALSHMDVESLRKETGLPFLVVGLRPPTGEKYQFCQSDRIMRAYDDKAFEQVKRCFIVDLLRSTLPTDHAQAEQVTKWRVAKCKNISKRLKPYAQEICQHERISTLVEVSSIHDGINNVVVPALSSSDPAKVIAVFVDSKFEE